MTLKLHVEHEVVGGEDVLETFEGVESFDDPPMTDQIHLSFDDKENEKLSYGNVVRAEAQ